MLTLSEALETGRRWNVPESEPGPSTKHGDFRKPSP